MIDATQILLAFVIVTFTVMLSVIAVQVFFILREFRQTLTKANKVLDDTGIISESISKPINMLSTLVSGAKIGSAIASALKSQKKTTKEGENV